MLAASFYSFFQITRAILSPGNRRAGFPWMSFPADEEGSLTIWHIKKYGKAGK